MRSNLIGGARAWQLEEHLGDLVVAAVFFSMQCISLCIPTVRRIRGPG